MITPKHKHFMKVVAFFKLSVNCRTCSFLFVDIFFTYLCLHNYLHCDPAFLLQDCSCTCVYFALHINCISVTSAYNSLELQGHSQVSASLQDLLSFPLSYLFLF